MKLNLGAGDWPIAGWTNLDRNPNAPGVEKGEAFPLPYPDNSVEAIRASHILEHFGEREVFQVLKEWFRVLKPGGTLHIAVPDFDYIRNKGPRWDDYLMGGQTHEDNFHKSVYDAAKLDRLFTDNGFVDVKAWTAEQPDCSSLAVSLNRMGTKPMAESIDVKICAVMSLPRLGFNDSWGCIERAFRPFGIPVTHYTSAYWHQSMQNALELCVENKADWVFTLDYDSLFTAKHVDTMMGTFGAHPEIDALASIQCKRGGGEVLASMKDEGGNPVERVALVGSPIRVQSAHFGLTLLRVDALRTLPKPWFMPVPSPTGSWNVDDGHIDADVDFWRRWRDAGRTLFLDPGACIGHLETVVSHCGPDGGRIYSSVADWKKAQE